MDTELLQKLLDLLRILRQNPDSACTQILALPSEFKLDSHLECFGSIDEKDNAIMNNQHSDPIHISGVINCSKTHILIGDIFKLSSNREYLKSFITTAVNYKLFNLLPV